MNNILYKKIKNHIPQLKILFFIIFYIITVNIRINSHDEELYHIEDIEIDEELKKFPVIFDFGGGFEMNSRILFKTFRQSVDGGFQPVPDDKWYGDITAKIWGRMTFEEQRYLHLGVIALLNVKKNDYGYRYNTMNLLFNVEELYFNWKYKIGKVVIGRTNYNLKSTLVFNGPLDGMEMDINIPYLNFKTFIGFTGFIGIFNPYFNPYAVTSMDTIYEEESNLLLSKMIVKFNAEQARRLFFATDFDIHFFGQHINPYFLMQYDLTSLFFNLNSEFDVNTFHLGLNMEGRIARNFYYQTHVSGLFGTYPTTVENEIKTIAACAIEAKIRYTVPKPGHFTLFIGYALGTGNYERNGTWSKYADDSDEGFWSAKYDGELHNKYYYYGNFDGGYVLNPILSNIHSISLKFLVTPFDNSSSRITIYAAAYQTFKLWIAGPISDEDCDLDDYIVGTEIDTGMMINGGPHFNFGFDFGIFIPETAYSDRSLKFKLGGTIGAYF